MKTRYWRVICLLGAGLIAGSAAAIEPEKGVDEFGQPLEEQFHPGFQLAVGIDQRIDDSRYILASPSLRGNLYFFLSRGFALKAALSYTYATKDRNSPGTEARSLGLELGLRLVIVNASPVAPFLEAGYSRFHYDGMDDYLERTASRNGLFGRLGLAVNLGHDTHLDVAISQVFNDGGIYMGPLPSSGLPVDPGPPDYRFFDCVCGRGSPKLFNPAAVELSVRFDI
jgi:hypothetical protein